MDYVEVTPTISILGHARIVTFMALLLVGGWTKVPYAAIRLPWRHSILRVSTAVVRGVPAQGQAI